MRLRIPRSLIDASRVDLPPADAEGLVDVRLQLEGARIGAIVADREANAEEVPLAITPPVEPHAHLDKTFSAPAFANSEGTLDGALAANLREFAQRSAAQVQQRSDRALQQAFQHGLRAIRSHIDSGPGPGREASWEVLSGQRQRWAGRIDLQLVALVPIQFWLGPEAEALARRVAGSGGLLGGVIGPPYGRSLRDGQALEAMLQLAGRHGCGIDLHVDESEREAGSGVALIARTALRLRPGVPICCSHASSMALLPRQRLGRLCELMATAGLQVVALPRTNLWLLGRSSSQPAAMRPQAPIQQLQQAGVEVAVGGDNVQDPWFPGGDYDPIDLLRLCLCSSQLVPWRRQGLAPFTTAASRIMGLGWDGVLRPGCPADLLVLNARSWREVLARPPARQVLRGGAWVADCGPGPGPALPS